MTRGFLGQALVGHGEEGVERFEDHDFRTEAAPYAAQLQADDAGADHGELLRHALEIERAPVVDDVLAVELHARQFGRESSRDASTMCLPVSVSFLPSCAVNSTLPARQQFAVTLQRGDAGALEQHRDAAGAGLDDAGLALLHLRRRRTRRRSP